MAARALEKRRSKLNREDARARAVIETAREAIVLFTREGVVRDFNPVAEQIFGLSRAEAVGKNLADFAIPPALFHVFKNHLETAFRVGKDPLRGCIEYPASLRQNRGHLSLRNLRIGLSRSPQGKLAEHLSHNILTQGMLEDVPESTRRASREAGRKASTSVTFFCQNSPRPLDLCRFGLTERVISGVPCRGSSVRMERSGPRLFTRKNSAQAADLWAQAVVREEDVSGEDPVD